MPDASHDKLSYTKGALEKVRSRYDTLTREQLLDLVCELTKTYVLDQTIPFDLPIPERAAERAAGERDALPEPLPDGVPDEEPRASPAFPAHERFAQLVVALKKRASLPQLDSFSVEEGRVVLRVDNQKVTFGERVTVEFVPSQGRPRRPSGERPATTVDAPAASPSLGAPVAPTAPAPTTPAAEALPGARPGLPGGDGRTRQQSGPFGAPARPEPARGAPRPAPPAAPKSEPPAKKPEPRREGDLDDVDHIVERFKRLDLD